MSSKRKGIAVEGFMRGVGSQNGVTLITLEHCGVAHYLTMRQGAIADYGCFDWKNGQGNPGEGWKGDEKPVASNQPADSSPAPGGDTPPDVTPPADTTPTEPGGDKVLFTITGSFKNNGPSFEGYDTVCVTHS